MNKPLVKIEDGRSITTSVDVANYFDRKHQHVMESVRSTIMDVSETFSRSNFRPSTYTDSRGKSQPCYQLTRNGFAMIALGFTGKKATQFREAYITRFDEMEGVLLRANYRKQMLNDIQIDDRVRQIMGEARSVFSLTFAYNLMIARGLHIPPISQKRLAKLVETGVIDGYKDNRQWHVYQDSFGDWLERRKLPA